MQLLVRNEFAFINLNYLSRPNRDVMGIRSFLSKPFAKYVVKQQDSWAKNPVKSQEKIFNDLISVGRSTVFGKDHGFDKIQSYEDYKKAVPVRDYEGLKPYIEQILAGRSDVLWKGKPECAETFCAMSPVQTKP